MGREMAYLLAEKRYSLVLAARSEQVLQRMKSEIELVHKPVEALVCACDLSTREGIAALVEFVKARELVVDILINNAGSSITKDFVDMTTDEIDSLMTLDMVATVQLTHAIVPQMAKRGVGRVLNVSSIAASFVTPSAAVYASAKAFLSSFTQALSYELRATGVTTTCFVPGPVETNFAGTADIKRAFCMIIPGIQNDAKDAAKVALDAMFNADVVRHDSWFAYLSAFAARTLLPPRIGAFCAAAGLHEPSKLLSILKR
jgi:short-subunit dehydrogenase